MEDGWSQWGQQPRLEAPWSRQKGKLNQAAPDTARFVCSAGSKGAENAVIGGSTCSTGLKSWGISTEPWLTPEGTNFNQKQVQNDIPCKSQQLWSYCLKQTGSLCVNAQDSESVRCSFPLQICPDHASRDFYLLLKSSPVFRLWMPGLQTGSPRV